MSWDAVVDQAVAQIGSGSLPVALGVAGLAGLVSFASPCVVPLLPGYLGYLGGMVGAGAGETDRARGTRAGRGRLLAGVALFVAGFTVVFVVFGILVSAIGVVLARWQDVVLRVAGVLVILLGLSFAGALPFLQRDRRLHPAPRADLWGAPLLGVTFGLGWAPCIGPTLAAVLALAFGQGDVGRGALLAAAYCVGLGLPFLLVALAVDSSARVVGVLHRHARTVQIAGGVLLVVLGIVLVTGVWGQILAQLQGSVAGFETAL